MSAKIAKVTKEKVIEVPWKDTDQNKQLSFMDLSDDHKNEWQDMPEFNHPGGEAHRSIIINFLSDKAVQEFMEVIGQTIPPKVRSIWYPKNANIIAGTYKDTI